MGYQPQGTADRFQAGLDEARQGGAVQAQRRHARTDADRRHAFPGHGHPGQPRRQGETPRHRRLEIRRRVSADLPSSAPPRPSCIAATPPRFDCISKSAPWWWWKAQPYPLRSEEHTSELQSQSNLVCRLLLEKKKKNHVHMLHIDVNENKERF